VRAAVVCIAVALVGSSCGGGDRLSSHAFVHDATAICGRVSGQTERTQVPRLSEQRAAADALKRLVAADRDLLGELRDLHPPKAWANRVTLWLAVIEQLLDEADHAVAALEQGDAVVARGAASRVAALGRRAHVLARENDVTGCRFPELGTT
jgi:hypothetical protein